MRIGRIACALVAGAVLVTGNADDRVEARALRQTKPGVLLLAHGGSAQWNDNVRALAARVDEDQPVEVAFGMATRANIQTAIDALVKRGVSEIIAVPLFVSSYSSVVTSTEYLLGLRAEAPADLATFTKMSHGQAQGAATAAHGHEGHAAAPSDGTCPVTSSVPVRMSRALDSHPIVAAIRGSRPRHQQDPAHESVVLVAHGPVKDDENQQWLETMATLAAGIRKDAPYANIDWMTVRDDAPPAIRDAASAAELRALVTKRSQPGARVLVVPVLLSFGGIEQGIRKRLDGLDYTMTTLASNHAGRQARGVD